MLFAQLAHFHSPGQNFNHDWTQILHQIHQLLCSFYDKASLAKQSILQPRFTHHYLKLLQSCSPAKQFFLVKFDPSCSPANDSSAKFNQQYAQMVMLPSQQQPLFTPKFTQSVMLPCQTIPQPFPLIILKLLVLSSAISMHKSFLSAQWRHLLAKRGE